MKVVIKDIFNSFWNNFKVDESFAVKKIGSLISVPNVFEIKGKVFDPIKKEITLYVI